MDDIGAADALAAQCECVVGTSRMRVARRNEDCAYG